MEVGRRRFLITAAAAGVAGCSSNSPAPPSPKPCSTPATGPGIGACLLESVELRVPGAARLAVGQVVLMVLTDNSAAIVARDELGLYARSAICTHACCIVNICSDGACSSPKVNAASCASPSPGALVRSGTAFLCPCHGSAFDAFGAVISGPASGPLPSLAARVDGEDVVVDLSRTTTPRDRFGAT